MKTSVRSIRMQDDIFLKMKVIADYEGRSTTKQIERALINHITEFERNHGIIKISEK